MDICSYGCGLEAKYTLKNGKFCCERSCNQCPEVRKKNSLSLKTSSHYIRFNPSKIMDTCTFCNKSIPYPSKKGHEKSCYLNPNNLKLCIVCEKPIKNYKFNITCSHICANGHFKQNTKNGIHCDEYRRICFKYHKKECIICGESNIVHAHHLDKNKENNSPKNLIPLCPTHHYYMHCKLKELIINKIESYLREWENSMLLSTKIII